MRDSQMPVGKMSVGKTSVVKMSVGQMNFDQGIRIFDKLHCSDVYICSLLNAISKGQSNSIIVYGTLDQI
jgi:hypothetical protein